MFSKISTGVIAILTAASLCASEFSDAQAKVKAKYPEEFEEIMKLAETDFDAARKKLNELADKADVKLPGGTGYGRGGQFGGQSGSRPGGRGGQFGGRGGQFGGRGYPAAFCVYGHGHGEKFSDYHAKETAFRQRCTQFPQ